MKTLLLPTVKICALVQRNAHFYYGYWLVRMRGAGLCTFFQTNPNCMGRSTQALVSRPRPNSRHIQGVWVSKTGVRYVRYNGRWCRFDRSPFNRAHLAHFTRNLQQNRRFPYDRIIAKNKEHTQVFVEWSNGEKTWEPVANFPQTQVQRAPLCSASNVGASNAPLYLCSGTVPGRKSATGLGKVFRDTKRRSASPKRCTAHPKRYRRSSYRYDAPYNTTYKKTVNTVFATSVQALSTVSRDQTGACIYLDAEGANTTKALAHARVPLPCYCVNFNQIIVNSWKFPRQLELDVTPICTPFQEAVQHVGEQKKVAAVFADFCCTFEGTATVQPKKDLEIVFRYLETEAVVAFTFSLRDRRLKKPHSAQIISIRRWMQSTADRFGYSCRFKFQLAYPPSMYVAMVYLRTRRA